MTTPRAGLTRAPAIRAIQRRPTAREYVMCRPDHFTVAYAINPWMDPSRPVDTDRAVAQWETLRATYVAFGHRVHVLESVRGLPDMVFAANGAFSIDGVVYGARFRHSFRTAEAAAHRQFYPQIGAQWRYVEPTEINEGEGDFVYLPAAQGGLILAGHGFRTEPTAHGELQEVLGRPVVSLQLIDPRFYHLDVALAAIDDHNIVYYPQAFSAGSRQVLRRLFPDALIADTTDALAFGLNLVSDGRNVVLSAEASGLATKLAAAGYAPVPVELFELKKGGGSVKCCVAELRPVTS